MPVLDVVIVDDEPVAVRRLAGLLRGCKDVAVTGTAANAGEALALVERTPPDLILLDIEMPGMSGIGLAGELRSVADRPAIIFVTAFSRFALEAFDVAATDYLLKPVEAPRLAEAIERVRRNRSSRKTAERIAELESLVQRLRNVEGASASGENPSLWLPSGRGQERVPIRDIVWAEAERDYVRIHTAGRSYFVRARLGKLEKRLGEHGVIRVHRSALVSATAIARIEPRGDRGFRLILSTGTSVDASRRFAARVRALIADKS
jgi:DNA-binding LytR/AlgR family response regulator